MLYTKNFLLGWFLDELPLWVIANTRRMKLTLDRSQVSEYARMHQNAMLLHHVATNDYVACRCCLINGLVAQGHVLAEQAVEKELKSIIQFHSMKEHFGDKKVYNQHNISDLIRRLTEITSLDLSKYDSLAVTLTNTYKAARYPDHKLSQSEEPRSMSSEIINEVDEMFFSLVDISPMPPELKFRSGIYVHLLDRSKSPNLSKFWARLSNLAFESRREKLSTIFQEVMGHLYPNSN